MVHTHINALKEAKLYHKYREQKIDVGKRVKVVYKNENELAQKLAEYTTRRFFTQRSMDMVYIPENSKWKYLKTYTWE
jgi:hypothetical protein